MNLDMVEALIREKFSSIGRHIDSRGRFDIGAANRDIEDLIRDIRAIPADEPKDAPVVTISTPQLNLEAESKLKDVIEKKPE